MNKQKNDLYVSPLDFPADSAAAAIQAAVDEAVRTDIRTVVIPARENGEAWTLNKPILLPSGITVILDGCIIRGSCTVFANANAYQEDTKTLGGEEHDLFLIGKNGSRIVSETEAPQIYLSNVKDFRVAGISFTGSAGVKLHFARYGKVQQLKFENTRHGISMGEGCSNLLVSDIEGVTQEETILMQGGESVLYGRDPDMRKSIFCRIQAKTGGAPAVGLYAGAVPMSYLILRDVTDLTESAGVSVRLGETQQEIRDITIRGVDSRRAALETTAACDSLHCADLRGSIEEKAPNIRSSVDQEKGEIALPRFDEDSIALDFLTPNDPAFYGETDGQTIQNTIDAAKQQGVSCVVIPRWNARTQSSVWNIEKAIRLPSDLTVELWGAHLRQADFCYENMFLAKDAANITITGFGDAVLDGGKHNGLLERTAGKYGFGPIEDNAMLRFVNVSGLKLEHFRVNQSRWFALHLARCNHADLGNIDFSTYSLFADLGGIQLRSGCHDILIHDLTGVVSDALVSLTAQGCDAAETEEEKHIRNVTIRDIKADVRRWAMVGMRNHDGRCIRNVTIDTLLDVSLAEQKMNPEAAMFIGSTMGYYERQAQMGELSHITVRDLYSRAVKAVVFGGYSDDVMVDNVHCFSGITSAVGIQNSAEVRGVKLKNLYFHCDQASGYMRGTATSIITDKKKFRGVALDLTKLKGDVTVDGLITERVSGAVKLTGGAAVCVTNLDVAEYGKFLASCDDQSVLTVNGERIIPD